MEVRQDAHLVADGEERVKEDSSDVRMSEELRRQAG
jgi:hypothetical protein